MNMFLSPTRIRETLATLLRGEQPRQYTPLPLHHSDISWNAPSVTEWITWTENMQRTARLRRPLRVTTQTVFEDVYLTRSAQNEDLLSRIFALADNEERERAAWEIIFWDFPTLNYAATVSTSNTQAYASFKPGIPTEVERLVIEQCWPQGFAHILNVTPTHKE